MRQNSNCFVILIYLIIPALLSCDLYYYTYSTAEIKIRHQEVHLFMHNGGNNSKIPTLMKLASYLDIKTTHRSNNKKIHIYVMSAGGKFMEEKESRMRTQRVMRLPQHQGWPISAALLLRQNLNKSQNQMRGQTGQMP